STRNTRWAPSGGSSANDPNGRPERRTRPTPSPALSQLVDRALYVRQDHEGQPAELVLDRVRDLIRRAACTDQLADQPLHAQRLVEVPLEHGAIRHAAVPRDHRIEVELEHALEGIGPVQKAAAAVVVDQADRRPP